MFPVQKFVQSQTLELELCFLYCKKRLKDKEEAEEGGEEEHL